MADSTNCTIEGKPWPTFDPGANSGNVGSGHLWPVLGGERGEYDVADGNSNGASALLTAMRNMTSGQGLEPEQVWEDDPVPATDPPVNPTTDSIGFATGHPAGSASPLTWAQSQYARLALAISSGRNLETPGIVTRRYVKNGPPGSLALTATSTVSGSTVTVSGTTTPGARVDAEAVGGTGGVAAIASATADGAGNWTVMLPAGFGGTTVTVTATLHRSTGYTRLSVTNVSLPGNQVLDITDPPGDDNGPGTYAYPLNGVFVPGAFDLTEFKVSETGTQVYIQAKIRNLVNTFGSSFGAQLLDVYVRNPAVANTSTAAAYSIMNYGIAPADAWTERLEAQGFASPIWVNGSNTSMGNPQFVVDDTSGTATLILPESDFGTPGHGWVFTVALTGQGAGQPPVRDFQTAPQDFSFGVCATGQTGPICSVPAGTVPTVMDTIPPQGVSQATELDPTHQPVLIQGVSP